MFVVVWNIIKRIGPHVNKSHACSKKRNHRRWLLQFLYLSRIIFGLIIRKISGICYKARIPDSLRLPKLLGGLCQDSYAHNC